MDLPTSPPNDSPPSPAASTGPSLALGTATAWVRPDVTPSGPGCLGCTRSAPPTWWFHLRRCATCGHVGCCDSSPQQHARKHYVQTGHPVIRSFEPEESWFYDYRADAYASCPELCAPSARPAEQPAPGPAGLVPVDWRDQLH